MNGWNSKCKLSDISEAETVYIHTSGRVVSSFPSWQVFLIRQLSYKTRKEAEEGTKTVGSRRGMQRDWGGIPALNHPAAAALPLSTTYYICVQALHQFKQLVWGFCTKIYPWPAELLVCMQYTYVCSYSSKQFVKMKSEADTAFTTVLL